MECQCINSAASKREGRRVICGRKVYQGGYCKIHQACKNVGASPKAPPAPARVESVARDVCQCINSAASKREGRRVICGRKVYQGGYCKIHQACKNVGASPKAPPAPARVASIARPLPAAPAPAPAPPAPPAAPAPSSPVYVGSGTYGCVYRPAIPCNPGQVVDGSISKVMKAQEAKEEIANGRKLDLARIDPGQLSSVSTIHTCPLPAKYRALISKTCARGKTHPSPTVLTSMDGGQSFQSYIERTDNPSAILQPLLPIFELVAALNSNRKYHMDIKPDNIVIRDGRARLIDYGLAIDSHPGESIDVYTQPYAIWPPELKLLDRKSYLDQRDAGTYEYFRSTFLKYNIDISALFREIIRIRTSSAPLTADEILGGADTWGLGMTLIISAYQIFNIIPARARSALDTLIKAMFHPDIRKRPAAGELAIMYRALIARYFP